MQARSKPEDGAKRWHTLSNRISRLLVGDVVADIVEGDG